MSDKNIIPREIFGRVYSLCRQYDPFTWAIDNGRQEESAERANARIKTALDEIVSEYGLEMNYIPYGVDCSNYENEAKIALEKWFNDKGFEVEPAPPKKVWREDQINYFIQTNDDQLYKALNQLYSRDLFKKEDKDFLVSVSQFLIKTGHLTDKQKAVVRKKLTNYTKQLTDIANSQ